MKTLYEIIFYSLYKSAFRFNKKDAEAITVIMYSFYMTINLYLLPLELYKIISGNLFYSVKIYFLIFVIVLVFNFIYFEKNNYFNQVINKFITYKNNYCFDIIGALYPTLMSFVLMLFIDLGITPIIIIICLYLLLEFLGFYFGNKWTKLNS